MEGGLLRNSFKLLYPCICLYRPYLRKASNGHWLPRDLWSDFVLQSTRCAYHRCGWMRGDSQFWPTVALSGKYKAYSFRLQTKPYRWKLAAESLQAVEETRWTTCNYEQLYIIDHVRHGARKDCACGHSQADTIHHCRDCAIAIHIYGLLQPENLFPHTCSHFQQLLYNIWTNSAPTDFPRHIWTIASLLTIYSIEIDRKTSYRMKYHPQTKQPNTNQRIIKKAQQEAEAFFWTTLAKYKQMFPKGKEVEEYQEIRWYKTREKIRSSGEATPTLVSANLWYQE